MDAVNVTSRERVTEWVVLVVAAASIEANDRAIRPLHVITVVRVHGICLVPIRDHNALEGVGL